jgi:hypothetical protein
MWRGGVNRAVRPTASFSPIESLPDLEPPNPEFHGQPLRSAEVASFPWTSPYKNNRQQNQTRQTRKRHSNSPLPYRPL